MAYTWLCTEKERGKSIRSSNARVLSHGFHVAYAYVSNTEKDGKYYSRLFKDLKKKKKKKALSSRIQAWSIEGDGRKPNSSDT